MNEFWLCPNGMVSPRVQTAHAHSDCMVIGPCPGANATSEVNETWWRIDDSEG
jgi:hypothetical protein